MNKIYRWNLVGVLMVCAGSAVGCTHQVVLPTRSPALSTTSPERGMPAISVLAVEDAVANPEQKKDVQSLGEDTSHWGLLGPLPIRHDTNHYRTEWPRADVIQSGLTAGLTKMTLPSVARPESRIDQVHSLPDGHLVLQTTLRSFEVTNENSLIIVLIANAGHLRKLNAHVTLECTLLQPGDMKPLWHGTVEGKAQWDAGQYGDAEISANSRWRDERGAVVRDAIEDAVSNLVIQSGMRQLSAKMLSEAHARLVHNIRERETAGDLVGALTLSAEGYRRAGTPEQMNVAVASMARVLRKLSAKPVLPEEVRRFGVQATSLVPKKRYDDAIMLYEKALDLAPWWAEGHFNRALVLANQSRYEEATASMKRFVTLAPESPDTRAAQDRIYEWELEMPGPGSMPSTAEAGAVQGSSSVKDRATLRSGLGSSLVGTMLAPAR